MSRMEVAARGGVRALRWVFRSESRNIISTLSTTYIVFDTVKGSSVACTIPGNFCGTFVSAASGYVIIVMRAVSD